MYKVKQRTNKQKRILRVRAKVVGLVDRPRLSVFRSNKVISAQIIDDVNHKTLVDINAEAKALHTGAKKLDAAFEVGKALAKKALEKGIKAVVFDRRSYQYHGRVKSLADGAREGGLQL